MYQQCYLNGTAYLQSTRLSAAYFSGLKSFAVTTIEKWVTLKGKKNRHKHETVCKMWSMLHSHCLLLPYLNGTVPCLVLWVPVPPPWWCSTTCDRTDRTRRCGNPCRPVSDSTCWAGLASDLSPLRDSTTPTVCPHSHLSLGRGEMKANLNILCVPSILEDGQTDRSSSHGALCHWMHLVQEKWINEARGALLMRHFWVTLVSCDSPAR